MDHQYGAPLCRLCLVLTPYPVVTELTCRWCTGRIVHLHTVVAPVTMPSQSQRGAGILSRRRRLSMPALVASSVIRCLCMFCLLCGGVRLGDHLPPLRGQWLSPTLHDHVTLVSDTMTRTFPRHVESISLLDLRALYQSPEASKIRIRVLISRAAGTPTSATSGQFNIPQHEEFSPNPETSPTTNITFHVSNKLISRQPLTLIADTITHDFPTPTVAAAPHATQVQRNECMDRCGLHLYPA